jgi:hypothetical protein
VYLVTVKAVELCAEGVGHMDKVFRVAQAMKACKKEKHKKV